MLGQVGFGCGCGCRVGGVGVERHPDGCVGLWVIASGVGI